MTIMCYIIENSAECAVAVRKLENTIPCFTSIDLLDDDNIEFTISCRAEDAIFVENSLAKFV